MPLCWQPKMLRRICSARPRLLAAIKWLLDIITTANIIAIVVSLYVLTRSTISCIIDSIVAILNLATVAANIPTTIASIVGRANLNRHILAISHHIKYVLVKCILDLRLTIAFLLIWLLLWCTRPNKRMFANLRCRCTWLPKTWLSPSVNLTVFCIHLIRSQFVFLVLGSCYHIIHCNLKTKIMCLQYILYLYNKRFTYVLAKQMRN